MDDLATFAERLHVIKRRKRLSTPQIAAVLGISTSTIEKWLAGECFPNMRYAAPLARLLGCSLDWLTGLASFEDVGGTRE